MICEFFYCCKLYAQTNDSHCFFHLCRGRIRGRDADVFIFGVVFVGEGRACGCEGDACLLAKRNDALCSAGHYVKRDEIAAVGFCPVNEIAIGEIFAEDADGGVKFRLQDRSVFFHQCTHVVSILQILHVAKLIDLIGGDGLERDISLSAADIFFAGDHERDACACVGDLRGGEERINEVFVFCALDEIEDIEQLVGRLVEVMERVRHIPENAEVFCGGAERCNAANGLVAVRFTRGIGIFRYAPDTLHRGILDELFHFIHVRTVTGHGDGNKLDAASFADGKMSVIAGNGAEEFDLALILPRQAVAVSAEKDRAANGIIHHIKAGVTAEDDVFCRYIKKLCKKSGKLRYAAGQTVVSNVKAGGCLAVILALEGEEKLGFLADLGIEESGLDKLIKSGYSLLGLISFLTAGPKEVRAWTITKGTKAPGAAGKIHTDFERGFIRAEVVSFDDLVREGDRNKVKEKGLLRSEGKEYVMKDGDIVEFLFNV